MGSFFDCGMRNSECGVPGADAGQGERGTPAIEFVLRLRSAFGGSDCGVPGAGTGQDKRGAPAIGFVLQDSSPAFGGSAILLRRIFDIRLSNSQGRPDRRRVQSLSAGLDPNVNLTCWTRRCQGWRRGVMSN